MIIILKLLSFFPLTILLSLVATLFFSVVSVIMFKDKTNAEVIAKISLLVGFILSLLVLLLY